MTTITHDDLVELAKYRSSFAYFISNLVYILDPPPGRGVIKWEAWDYLASLAQELPYLAHLVILKGRQLGLSWLLAAYGLWRAMFYPGAFVGLLSQGEIEAQEFLAKAIFIYDHLPEQYKPVRTNDARGVLEFGNIYSKIMAFPSTSKAGSGFTGTLIICDEHAKHSYAATNYAALEPTINAGAQFISVSTAWGVGNFFHQLYEGAVAGLNGFTARFYHAQLRPGRDERWYENTHRNYDGLPHLFFQEYPRTDQEAFQLTAGMPVFDLQALERLEMTGRPPLHREDYPQGTLSIWEEPIVGQKYVCGTDVSYGFDTPDSGVTQVIHARSGRHVASLAGHFAPDDLADRTVALAKKYNRAFLGVEANGVGEFCIRRIEALGYSSPDVFYHADWEEAQRKGTMPKRQGWYTGAGTRDVMINDLREAVRKGMLQTPDKDTINEMRTFVIEDGKPQAAEGTHDDRVMALAIALQMTQVPFATSGRQTKGYAGIGSSR